MSAKKSFAAHLGDRSKGEPATSAAEVARRTKHCHFCFLTEDVAGRIFAMCSACHSVRYCSKACQKQAWKGSHKAICRNFQTMLADTTPSVQEGTDVPSPLKTRAAVFDAVSQWIDANLTDLNWLGPELSGVYPLKPGFNEATTVLLITLNVQTDASLKVESILPVPPALLLLMVPGMKTDYERSHAVARKSPGCSALVTTIVKCEGVTQIIPTLLNDTYRRTDMLPKPKGVAGWIETLNKGRRDT